MVVFSYSTFPILPPLGMGAVSASAVGAGFGTLLAGLCVLVFAVASLVAMAMLLRRYKFKAFGGFMAVAASAAAMVLCIIATNSGTLIARPDGDPRETVTGFFDALTAGNYEEAYGYLSQYSDLGLDGQSSDPTGQLLVDALRRSYSYELYGVCSIDKLSAHQQVQFTYLSLPATEDDAAGRIMDILSGFVEERSYSELYDDHNNYLPEVAQEAYTIAVTEALRNPKDHYATVGIQLELEYLDGSWFLVPSQSLLSAIAGGAA